MTESHIEQLQNILIAIIENIDDPQVLQSVIKDLEDAQTTQERLTEHRVGKTIPYKWFRAELDELDAAALARAALTETEFRSAAEVEAELEEPNTTKGAEK